MQSSTSTQTVLASRLETPLLNGIGTGGLLSVCVLVLAQNTNEARRWWSQEDVVLVFTVFTVSTGAGRSVNAPPTSTSITDV